MEPQTELPLADLKQLTADALKSPEDRERVKTLAEPVPGIPELTQRASIALAGRPPRRGGGAKVGAKRLIGRGERRPLGAGRLTRRTPEARFVTLPHGRGYNMREALLPVEPVSANRVFRYSPFLDLWRCRLCEYAPWPARDTDDPLCRDLDTCPHCGFDGDDARLYRFRVRCCK